MFLDEAIVQFNSGTGGSGAVSFHREKYVPRGGPNGADGGRGGDITLIAERGKRTLYDFKLKDVFEAMDGVHAHGNKRGRDGKPIEIKVPVGTVITDVDLGETLCDLNVHGMSYRIAKGGRGGHGNQHYVSSVRQVPNFAEKGEPGERVRAKLELKLLADVGLVGLPNAGKSTLLSRISAARPKIADYPFTTIVPNLGVVSLEGATFVVADMPGLIEGASEGHGLGHQFLKHIERTKVLIHVVDVFPIDESDPLANYELIEKEIQDFSPEIFERPRLIALNKIDMTPLGEYGAIRQKFESLPHPVFSISAVSGEGLPPLLFETLRILESIEAVETVPVLLPGLKIKDDEGWDIVEVDDGYEIRGRRVRRMVAMTDLNNGDAVRYLHRRLERLGVVNKLREMGVEEGSTVFVNDFVFEFTDKQ